MKGFTRLKRYELVYLARLFGMDDAERLTVPELKVRLATQPRDSSTKKNYDRFLRHKEAGRVEDNHGRGTRSFTDPTANVDQGEADLGPRCRVCQGPMKLWYVKRADTGNEGRPFYKCLRPAKPSCMKEFLWGEDWARISSTTPPRASPPAAAAASASSGSATARPQRTAAPPAPARRATGMPPTAFLLSDSENELMANRGMPAMGATDDEWMGADNL